MNENASTQILGSPWRMNYIQYNTLQIADKGTAVFTIRRLCRE